MILFIFFHISMCPPVLYRPARFDPLLRGLRNAMCFKVYGRVLKMPPPVLDMKFCLICFPVIFHQSNLLKPFSQHQFCDGPFTVERCRRCKRSISLVQPIYDCAECFPMYIHVYNMLREENHNMSELLVLHYDTNALNVIKLHFNFISPPFIENPDPVCEDRDNMLE